MIVEQKNPKHAKRTARYNESRYNNVQRVFLKKVANSLTFTYNKTLHRTHFLCQFQNSIETSIERVVLHLLGRGVS